jgi:hypothetical protein
MFDVLFYADFIITFVAVLVWCLLPDPWERAYFWAWMLCLVLNADPSIASWRVLLVLACLVWGITGWVRYCRSTVAQEAV